MDQKAKTGRPDARMSFSVPKAFAPEDFLTRSERLKQLQIPKSTQKMVVIPANNEACGFRFDSYNSSVLQDKVDKKRFDQTVLMCHKICEEVWKIRKRESENDLNENAKKLLTFSIFLVIAAMILVVIAIYGERSDNLFNIAMICLGASASITLTIVVRSMFTLPKFTDFEETVLLRLKIFLKCENEYYYHKRGLEWKCQDRFYWLELHVIPPKENKDSLSPLKSKTISIIEIEKHK